MKTGLPLLALAGPLLMAPAGAPPPRAAAPHGTGLCTAGETVIFECHLGAKRVAICGGAGPAGHAQYRLGVPGKLELAYPARAGETGTMHHAETAYSGGGEAQVVFSNGGYRYVVYSRMIRTNFKPGQPNDPALEAGVTVLQGDKAVSKRQCARADGADVDVDAAARFMPEGAFVDLP